ncbi:TauD/TfdA family dioxygenase [Mesorhizobium sp. M0220]
MNTLLSVEARETALAVTFVSGETVCYPWLWLKDNAPSAFHPQTEERTFDLTSVDPSLRPISVRDRGSAVGIVWQNDQAEEEFPSQFFESYRPGRKRDDPADIAPKLWDASINLETMPRHAAGDILQSDADLLAWLKATAAYGLSIVDGLDDDPDAGRRSAERIGFLRQTNFGTMFEVVSMPNPNNLAYTPVALPLHTDLANQEVPPGYQFLHCIANDAEGGGSIFADGFAVVAALQAEDPEAYRLLCEIEIPYRFHDENYDLRGRFPVICNATRRGSDGVAVQRPSCRCHRPSLRPMRALLCGLSQADDDDPRAAFPNSLPPEGRRNGGLRQSPGVAWPPIVQPEHGAATSARMLCRSW